MQPGAEYSGQVEGEEIIRRSLYKIRKQKGAYSSLEEIKESVLMTEELYIKLKPYLTL